jgi:hypothetical protein
VGVVGGAAVFQRAKDADRALRTQPPNHLTNERQIHGYGPPAGESLGGSNVWQFRGRHRSEYLDDPLGRWTGDLSLRAHTSRAGASATVDDLDVTVHRDDVHVRHCGVTVALLDRRTLREWLIHPFGLYTQDAVTWSYIVGITCIDLRDTHYVLTRDWVSELVNVI